MAQIPVSGPDVSAWYRPTPAAVPLYKWLRVQPPLTVVPDGTTTGGLLFGVKVPIQIAETFHFTGATGTATVSLAHTPAPSTLLLIFFHASENGKDTSTAIVPGARGTRQVDISLPGYPMTDDDSLTIAYWTVP